MWLLYILFTSITLLVGWLLFGYFLFLWLVGHFRDGGKPVFPETWPYVSIVVPCFNEEKQIIDKIKNLRELDYPENRLEIVIADGGSLDNTLPLLLGEVAGDDSIRVVSCPASGKINQLNHVLPDLSGEIILNTDTDSMMAGDALKWICAEFSQSPEVKVVGAYCCPANTLEIESYYWAAQNKCRFIENDAHTATIVIAQCYAFKRELLKTFPGDVIADDVYIAFYANSKGFRSVYSRLARAVETRSPGHYREFIPHKFRKSNAFLRESIRFLYQLPEMTPTWKLMLVTRSFQQLILPWLTAFWVLLASSLLFLYQFEVVFLGVFFIGVLFVLTSRMFNLIELPGDSHRYSFLTVVKGFSVTLLIMLLTGLTYPFFRQGSDYSRIGAGQGKYEN